MNAVADVSKDLKESMSEICKLAAKDYVQGEEFIDSIVERLKKKQLSK